MTNMASGEKLAGVLYSGCYQRLETKEVVSGEGEQGGLIRSQTYPLVHVLYFIPRVLPYPSFPNLFLATCVCAFLPFLGNFDMVASHWQ